MRSYPLFLQFKSDKAALNGMRDDRMRRSRAFYTVALDRYYVLEQRQATTYSAQLFTTSKARALHFNSRLPLKLRGICQVLNGKRTPLPK